MQSWIRYVLNRWYIPISVMLAYWIAASFIVKYPAGMGGIAGKARSFQAEESILKTIEAIKKKRNKLGLDSSLSLGGDPFRSVKSTPYRRVKGGRKTIAPVRKYKLMGITNDKTAILVNNAGYNVIVEVGDAIDSAIVVSITSNKVILRDQGGTFEINLGE